MEGRSWYCERKSVLSRAATYLPLQCAWLGVTEFVREDSGCAMGCMFDLTEKRLVVCGVGARRIIRH